MDTRSGQIHDAAAVAAMGDQDKPYMREMGHHPTPEQRGTGKISRNDPCPCGSGKKFKRCCLFGGKSEEAK